MEPKFKQGERVWSKVYQCWGNIYDADIVSVLTDPNVQYHLFLDGHRGEYTTTEDYLESEAEHGTKV